jgi:mannosyl-oligosaccharide glucosidase
MSEGMARYGWTAYDTREGGRQIIEDVENMINITTEFIKHSKGQSEGSWGLRIKGIPRPDAPEDLKTAVVFYVGMEAMEDCASCKLAAREQLGAGDDKEVQAVNIDVSHPKLGSAGIHIPVSVNREGRYEESVVKTLNVTKDQLWQAKCTYRASALFIPLASNTKLNHSSDQWTDLCVQEATFLDSLKGQTPDKTKVEPTELVLRNAPSHGNMQLIQMICHGKFEVSWLRSSRIKANFSQFDVLYSSRAATRAMTCKYYFTTATSTVPIGLQSANVSSRRADQRSRRRLEILQKVVRIRFWSESSF